MSFNISIDKAKSIMYWNISFYTKYTVCMTDNSYGWYDDAFKRKTSSQGGTSRYQQTPHDPYKILCHAWTLMNRVHPSQHATKIRRVCECWRASVDIWYVWYCIWCDNYLVWKAIQIKYSSHYFLRRQILVSHCYIIIN